MGPARIFGISQPKKETPNSNKLISKLQSLACKVNLPNLKFLVLESNSDLDQTAKLHKYDIDTLEDFKITSKPSIHKPKVTKPPIAPIKIRLSNPKPQALPEKGK